MPGTLRKHLLKFDDLATDGIDTAVVDSLAYRVAEIEKHLHNWERWYGLAASPSGETHRADAIGAGIAAFQIDAGNNTWGAWVQVVGSSDAAKIFDMHRIMVTAVERAATSHFVQVAIGETAAAALTAGTYSEFVYHPAAVTAEAIPIDIMMRRAAAGSKAWARVLASGANTGTMDFYIGLHYYDG
jgi:hypothetical protein